MCNIKIKFVSQEMYSRGCTDISEPWNNKSQTDTYTYEIYDDDYAEIKTQIKIVDFYSRGDIQLKHKALIRSTIEALLELQGKIDAYENLTDNEKELLKKLKHLI